METAELRHRLTELLRSWDAGAVDEAHVRDTAEELEREWAGWRVLDSLPTGEEPPLLDAMAEILTILGNLEIHWITRADIPAMLACLERLDEDPITAREGWVRYADGVDWKARGRGLRGNPFYAFTGQ